MRKRVQEILDAPPLGPDAGVQIGLSREARPLRAFRFGTGFRKVSLLAGCHADEPVGPRALSQLCSYLSNLPNVDSMLSEFQWWIVPHLNPDGAERNREWQKDHTEAYDIVEYLSHRVRELPGHDIEFCFPRDQDDLGARPENRALYDWWRSDGGPFSLHVSLHGMGFSAGPWFLIEAEWKDRCSELKQRCVARVAELGYTLHDVQRHGEKGFFRLGRGFCTRPDSRYMQKHFLELGDEGTAALFRPSSMETIRAFGGNPLTLVSEMPLFMTPGVGAELGPPDPAAQQWKDRIDEWTSNLRSGAVRADHISARARELGLRAMPVRDQMDLQLTFIAAGLDQIARSR